MSKVISTKTYKDGEKTITVKEYNVVDSFTNAFADTVYTLEDGTQIFITYDQKYVQIRRVE